MPGVARVVTPAEGGDALVARDGSSALVAAVLVADADDADVVADAEDAFAGSVVVLGGGAVTQEQVSSQVQEDLLRAELIAMPLLLILCLWIFRSPIAALLPVLVGGSTVMGTFLVLRVIDAGVDGALGVRAQPRDRARTRPGGRLQPAARSRATARSSAAAATPRDAAAPRC